MNFVLISFSKLSTYVAVKKKVLNQLFIVEKWDINLLDLLILQSLLSCFR